MSVDPRLVQSVRQRLTNLARKNGEDVQRVLVRFAIERLLYRLSLSRYKDRFVLKGATLFSVWADAPYRSTGDLDLLGIDDNAPETLKAVFTEIAATVPAVSDGLMFDTRVMVADILRANTTYSGVNLRFDAMLGRARLPMMVDIGFGDVITPGPSELDFPSLLDMPTARLTAYPPETVIAEKLEAMVALGLATSRVKDLYDLWAISTAFEIDGASVTEAVMMTFQQRGTELRVGRPSMLTPAYTADASRQSLWRAFLQGRTEIENAPKDLAIIADEVAQFVEPVMAAASGGVTPGVWSSRHRTWSR